MARAKERFAVEGRASCFGADEIPLATGAQGAQNGVKTVKICFVCRLFNDDKARQSATKRESSAATFDDRRVF